MLVVEVASVVVPRAAPQKRARPVFRVLSEIVHVQAALSVDAIERDPLRQRLVPEIAAGARGAAHRHHQRSQTPSPRPSTRPSTSTSVKPRACFTCAFVHVIRTHPGDLAESVAFPPMPSHWSRRAPAYRHETACLRPLARNRDLGIGACLIIALQILVDGFSGRRSANRAAIRIPPPLGNLPMAKLVVLVHGQPAVAKAVFVDDEFIGPGFDAQCRNHVPRAGLASCSRPSNPSDSPALFNRVANRGPVTPIEKHRKRNHDSP